jgi:hypothetical protein
MAKAKSKEGQLTRYQKFENVRVHRSELKNAIYNPRMIHETARKRLREAIEKHGLVGTVTWNKTTGNIVGGHQRVLILDMLEKSPDYLLDVSMVEKTEKEEKEINIILNNPALQGQYELELLADIFDDGVNPLEVGFDRLELELEFPDKIDDWAETYGFGIPDEPDSQGLQADEAKAAAQIQAIKDRKKEYLEVDQAGESRDHYLILTFADKTAKDSFMETLGLPDSSRAFAAPDLIALMHKNFQDGKEFGDSTIADAPKLELEDGDNDEDSNGE